jgi:Glycosyltransferase family 87
MRAATLAVFTVGTPANRLLRFSLLVLAALPTLLAAWRLVGWQIPGVDLLISILATQRWVNGGEPYVASSFGAVLGPDLPFLYPPFVLPLLAPLLRLPVEWVLAASVGICCGVAVWTLGRFRVPLRWMPAFLVWAPFLEGIVSGNVGIIAFAAFAALFFARAASPADFHPTDRDPTDPRVAGVTEGLKATIVAAVKVSQVHASLYLLLRRPQAALAGLACLGFLVAATLPFTGIAIYGDWVRQLGRAVDPTWIYAGTGLWLLLPRELTLAGAAGSIVALWWVPRRSAGMWVGVLAVIGGLSTHTYGLLFLVPAMLRLRREIALVGAMFIGLLNPTGLAVGATVIVVGAVASIALPALREPEA